MITPDENEEAFQNQWALACSTPDQAQHKGKFVITLEPIADGRFGRAVLTGICAVRVDADTDDRTFADIADAETEHLVAGDSGAAQILWRKSGTGPQWAVVRLGNLGSAAAFLLAKITGRAGTAAPWLYSGVQVEHDGGSTFEPGDFTEVSGGPDLAWKLINLMEIGPGGAGVNPQEDGSIVMYWPMPAPRNAVWSWCIRAEPLQPCREVLRCSGSHQPSSMPPRGNGRRYQTPHADSCRLAGRTQWIRSSYIRFNAAESPSMAHEVYHTIGRNTSKKRLNNKKYPRGR